jgi:hypothetical protein
MLRASPPKPVAPKVGQQIALDIEPLEVEEWLTTLKKGEEL